MIDGSDARKPQTQHPVDELFLDRWSPRAFDASIIPEADLATIFEAARWAPSSYNNQPWRILYARRETEQWPAFFGLLVEGNQAWAKDAGALLLFVSKETFDFNGKPYPTHSFDTGAAWENLALQATKLGLATHGMQGFDYERARAELNIPEGFRVEAMIAVGRPGDPAQLPERLREREAPSGRKPLDEITCEGASNF